MISYTLSKREKVLLALLAVVVLVIVWFVFVYQNTANEIVRLDSEIAATQSRIEVDNARVAQMGKMQKEIDERKAQGVTPKPVPEYDNMTPLMNELNGILGSTDNYSLSFDPLDTSSGTYANRGVGITFRCDSYASARSVINSLANGKYPCVIDRLSIVDKSGLGGTNSILGLMTYTSSDSGGCSATLHVTYFERLTDKAQLQTQAQTQTQTQAQK